MKIARFSQKSALFLAAVVSVSLLSGPQITLAISAPMVMDITDCQRMDHQVEQAMIDGDNSGAIAPCCQEQKNEAQSGALTLNDLRPKETVQQNVSAGFINDGNFSGQLIPQANSTPPPQTKLLTSVIKIE